MRHIALMKRGQRNHKICAAEGTLHCNPPENQVIIDGMQQGIKSCFTTQQMSRSRADSLDMTGPAQAWPGTASPVSRDTMASRSKEQSWQSEDRRPSS